MIMRMDTKYTYKYIYVRCIRQTTYGGTFIVLFTRNVLQCIHNYIIVLPFSTVDVRLLIQSLVNSRPQELVASSPSERNWRGIFIALLVIAAVLGLIAFSIFLLSPDLEGMRVKGRRLQLSDIVGEHRLHWRRFNGTWLSRCSGSSGCGETAEDLVYRDRSGGLTVYDADAAETRVLMTNLAFVSVA